MVLNTKKVMTKRRVKMIKHPKPKITRTMRHGQRLTHKHEIAEPVRKPARETLEWVRQALSDSQPLDDKGLFILNQVLTAAERLVAEDQAEKDRLREQLEEAEDKGLSLGLDVWKIRGANAAAFLIENDGWLKTFIKQAQARVKH